MGRTNDHSNTWKHIKTLLSDVKSNPKNITPISPNWYPGIAILRFYKVKSPAASG